MKHLIVCPEYPPAPIAAGGIGTYVEHISRLLAGAGEIVHVVSVLWPGAPDAREELFDGRLIIHRLPLDRPLKLERTRDLRSVAHEEVTGLARSEFPSQSFSWQAALFAEVLIETEGIDIIESQEYDAPLYYFQVRRAIGYGPRRQPPCVVHLHSPTELIVKFNGWSANEPRFVTAQRMEAFSIAAADARMCPSQYLASHIETRYRLEEHSIRVIRLPIGGTALLQRNADVWQKGSICYVGRLEPRKGIIEWIDAAVSIADDYPSARFDFAGADLSYTPALSVRQHLEHHIPHRLKDRFVFHGQLPKAELRQHFAGARLAVVPSRWENFPNACLEAMCTGLPVIVSRNGGMCEMVEDERSGWLAPNQSVAGLRSVLKRALETPSLDLATMGRYASKTIHKLCDNERVLQEHLEFRSHVVERKSAGQRVSKVGVSTLPPGPARITRTRADTVVIVAAIKNYDLLEECLQRLRAQSRAALAVITVINEDWDESAKLAAQKAKASGWQIVSWRGASTTGAWNAGLRAIEQRDLTPGSFVFMDEADLLLPQFLEKCEDALCGARDAGIVSAWRKENGKFIAHPCASLPFSLLYNEFESPVMVRSEALRGAGGFLHEELNGYYGLWNLAIAILIAGWTGAVIPGLLCERFVSRVQESLPERHRMRREMFIRAKDVAATYVLDIVELLDSSSTTSPTGHSNQQSAQLPYVLRPRDIFRLTTRQQLRLLHAVLSNPKRASSFLIWHAKANVYRVAQRLK